MLEWLKTILGESYTEEIDQKVSAEIGRAFVSKGDFNTANTELKQARAALKERDSQLEELTKASGDSAALQQRIAELQAANEAQAEAHRLELDHLKMEHVVEQALTQAKARNVTAAKALLGEFLSKAQLNEEGGIKGLDEEIKKLSSAEDTAFLFGKEEAKPAIRGAVPLGTTKEPAPGTSSTLSEAISKSLSLQGG